MKNLKLKRLSLAVVLGVFTATGAQAVPLDGGTLDPLSIPKYVTPLVIPPVMKSTSSDNTTYSIGMREFKQQILPGGIWNTVNGRNDNFPATTVWSYGPSNDPRPDSRALGGGRNTAPAPNSQFNYPAYTIEATKDVNLSVDWINQLVKRPDRCRSVGGTIGTERNNDCKYISHLLSIDQTLHWANPSADCDKGELRTDCHGQRKNPYKGPVPIVTHVHGAHTGPSSDGYTEGWWLPNASDVTCVPRDPQTGNPQWKPKTANGEYVCEGTIANLLTNRSGSLDENIVNGVGMFDYLNDQPSTTLWYHDHALGMTRLNVYAGPAGFWLIRDPSALNGDTGLVEGTLPSPAPVAGEDLATTNFPAALGGEREKYREIPIVIQDRAFNADGSLWYPDNRAFFEGLNVQGTAGTANEQFPGSPELQINFAGNDTQDKVSDIAPIWNPEAFFNTMVVNGTTWPQLEVAPALYRFRLLNGTNSRFLNLSLPVIDPATDLQTSVRKKIWYQEVDNITGGYTGPWQLDEAIVNELYIYMIGTDQAMLPQVTAVRKGFATPLNSNPQAWALQQAPYMQANKRRIVGEIAQSTIDQALLMGPAERADVIVDFRGLPNGTVVRMINTAPDAPFGGFPDAAADPNTTGQVMQFMVNSALSGNSASDQITQGQALATPGATDPWDLKLGLVDNNATPPVDTARDLVLIEEESTLVCFDVDIAGNQIQLNEIPVNGVCPTATAAPFGPKAAVLGTTDTAGVDSVTLWSDPIVTSPGLNTTEAWNIKNITADAHPIHVHLVKYKVNSRTDLTGAPSPTVLHPNGMEAWENGWKDTVITYPGEITQLQAEFDIPGLYVWHCHIVEHEDNEMMVPFCVGGSESEGGVCPDKLF